MIADVRQRQAHILGRLPAHVAPQRVRRLPMAAHWRIAAGRHCAPQARRARAGADYQLTLSDPARPAMARAIGW